MTEIQRDPVTLINNVAENNHIKPTWFLGGICKAVFVNLRTLFSSTDEKAKYASRMLNENCMQPQSLRWFSPEVIEKIRPAHPLDLAKGAASTQSVAKKAAFGKAYANCFESGRVEPPPPPKNPPPTPNF